MAGIPHDHYKPKTGMQKWFHERLPIASLIYDTLTIPTPKNVNSQKYHRANVQGKERVLLRKAFMKTPYSEVVKRFK